MGKDWKGLAPNPRADPRRSRDLDPGTLTSAAACGGPRCPETSCPPVPLPGSAANCRLPPLAAPGHRASSQIPAGRRGRERRKRAGHTQVEVCTSLLPVPLSLGTGKLEAAKWPGLAVSRDTIGEVGCTPPTPPLLPGPHGPAHAPIPAATGTRVKKRKHPGCET